MTTLLQYHGSSGAYVAAREPSERYSNMVKILQPDILIEAGCKSINDLWQICITIIKLEIQKKIRHIAFSEFEGYDNLSDNMKEH